MRVMPTKFLRNHFYVVIGITIVCFAACVTSSASVKKHVPEQAITVSQVNLSGALFLEKLVSKDPVVRASAELYMLGVLDTTESKTWCEYKKFKISTIKEYVYEFIRKLPASRMSERASNLIQEAVNHHFPCKAAS